MKAPGVFYYKGRKIVRTSRKLTFYTIHGKRFSWFGCKELDWYFDSMEEFKQWVYFSLYSKQWDKEERTKVRKYYR